MPTLKELERAYIVRYYIMYYILAFGELWFDKKVAPNDPTATDQLQAEHDEEADVQGRRLSVRAETIGSRVTGCWCKRIAQKGCPISYLEWPDVGVKESPKSRPTHTLLSLLHLYIFGWKKLLKIWAKKIKIKYLFFKCPNVNSRQVANIRPIRSPWFWSLKHWALN
jgi:hypothetical protein